MNVLASLVESEKVVCFSTTDHPPRPVGRARVSPQVRIVRLRIPRVNSSAVSNGQQREELTMSMHLPTRRRPRGLLAGLCILASEYQRILGHLPEAQTGAKRNV